MPTLTSTDPEGTPFPRGGIGGRRRWASRCAVVAVAAVTLAACGQSTPSASNGTSTPAGGSATTVTGAPVYGGTANVSIVSDPPSLDWTSSTSTVTRSVSSNVFEQLFTLDQNYKIRPMLATGYTISNGGLTYTIPLRTGVSFQNGQSMTSADVVASIHRWMKIASGGRIAAHSIKSVTASGSQTVVIDLTSPYASLLSDLASSVQACIVIPASIAHAAGTTPLTTAQIIGTGPYKLTSWVHNQVIQLTAWKGYKALPAADNWGGLAGHKVAYLHQLDYRIASSSQVRLSGLQTGEFTVSTALSSSAYSQMSSMSGVKPIRVSPANALYAVFNKMEKPFTSLRMREAINLVMNKPQVAAAAFGNPKFWSLNDGMFFPQEKSLYTSVGSSTYNAYNPTKARQLMKSAGYNSARPLRILVTKSYPYMYKAGVTLAQELNSIGIKTSVIVYDWPTDLAVRKNPHAWDIFITGFAAEADDPTQLLWISPSYNGWYTSPQMQADIAEWEKATTAPQKTAALQAIQSTEWSQLPAVKIANQAKLTGISTKLQGFQPFFATVMWNTWLAR